MEVDCLCTVLEGISRTSGYPVCRSVQAKPLPRFPSILYLVSTFDFHRNIPWQESDAQSAFISGTELPFY